jgi:hypothetical protein
MFLSTTLDKMLNRPPPFKAQLLSYVPKLSSTLSTLRDCTEPGRPAAGKAKQLLGQHAERLLQLLERLLASQPAAAEKLSEGQLSNAANMLTRMAGFVLRCVATAACDSFPGERVRAVRQPVLDGTAACCSWLPERQLGALQSLCQKDAQHWDALQHHRSVGAQQQLQRHRPAQEPAPARAPSSPAGPHSHAQPSPAAIKWQAPLEGPSAGFRHRRCSSGAGAAADATAVEQGQHLAGAWQDGGHIVQRSYKDAVLEGKPGNNNAQGCSERQKGTLMSIIKVVRWLGALF